MKPVAIETDLCVRRLIARFSQLVDDRDYKEVAELFTEDGRYYAGGQDMRGRDAIREFLEQITGPTLHTISNVVVSHGSQDGVSHAVSDFTVSSPGHGGAWSVGAVGRYHDTITGDGAEMLFAQRIAKLR